MNIKLAIAIVTLAIAGYILGVFGSDAFGATDDRSALHFGASFAIGAAANSIVLANQPVEQDKLLSPLGGTP